MRMSGAEEVLDASEQDSDGRKEFLRWRRRLRPMVSGATATADDRLILPLRWVLQLSFSFLVCD